MYRQSINEGVSWVKRGDMGTGRSEGGLHCVVCVRLWGVGVYVVVWSPHLVIDNVAIAHCDDLLQCRECSA